MKTKTFLITGATSGIGYEAAKQAVALGHTVIITGRTQDKLDAVSAELGVKAYLADSADLSAQFDLGEKLKKDKVTLDGLVLNAGVFYPSSFVEETPEQFDQSFAINTKGPFFTLQALLPCLAKPASVVFTSSIAVHKGFVGGAVYSATKAAFEGMVRTLNLELADLGIRVNSIRPGITATEIQAKAGMTKEQEQALFDSLQTTPVGRELVSDDHTGAILYLLDDASSALRNAVIEVDGGYCL
ncbi:SDR family oxidoreductase [Marinomonas sp. C2222]|uniref:SDR family oxidoreductase n=1 Tax=Marinomonas sargassi TaxID=2984494 RepID=A0ABT2YPP0_9GAMM|nr:SDR family oxidoreductase [Marinomonas sargassi]MCV2401835.1 SDR family oxidoreductase [Marinomonas sargassi]